MEKINKNKEFLMTCFFIAVCLILSAAFPSSGIFQNLTKGVFFLAIFPILYIKLILKKNLGDFGLNIQNRKTGLIWGSAMLLVSFAIAFIMLRWTAFPKNYKLSGAIVENYWIFLFNILIYSNLLLFTQEYFFRGFILSVFREKFFWLSAVIQFALYFIILLMSQRGSLASLWQLSPIIILSATSSVTAYKSRSMIYSYLSGLLFLFIFHSYLIYLIKIK
jgi:membrane protease YdiL (CAAX protease family)